MAKATSIKEALAKFGKEGDGSVAQAEKVKLILRDAALLQVLSENCQCAPAG